MILAYKEVRFSDSEKTFPFAISLKDVSKLLRRMSMFNELEAFALYRF